MAKLRLLYKARKLRRNGLGIKTIAYRLTVSSSTVSRWCKDITLSQEQLKELERRARDPFYGRRKDNILRQQQKKIQNIQLLKDEGIKEVHVLTEREKFIAGIALYWAEGFKKDKRLGFANSDPKMTQFFLRWLSKNCCVPKKDIRVRVGLNISHKGRIDEIEKYWARITHLPTNQFQKPFFQKVKWKKEFPKPEEYFGVLRIRANKQLKLFRKIHGWIEGLKLNSTT